MRQAVAQCRGTEVAAQLVYFYTEMVHFYTEMVANLVSRLVSRLSDFL